MNMSEAMDEAQRFIPNIILQEVGGECRLLLLQASEPYPLFKILARGKTWEEAIKNLREMLSQKEAFRKAGIIK